MPAFDPLDGDLRDRQERDPDMSHPVCSLATALHLPARRGAEGTTLRRPAVIRRDVPYDLPVEFSRASREAFPPRATLAYHRAARPQRQGTTSHHKPVRTRCAAGSTGGSQAVPVLQALHVCGTNWGISDVSYYFLIEDGGEGGIRTLDGLSPIHTFQACSFDRSDTSPRTLPTRSAANWR